MNSNISKFWQWKKIAKLSQAPNFSTDRIKPTCFSQNFTDWNIRRKIIHFSTILLDSMLEFNSLQIFFHAVLDSWLSRNLSFLAVFAWLATMAHTLPSFYLFYCLCCCLRHLPWFPHLQWKKIVSLTLFKRI